MTNSDNRNVTLYHGSKSGIRGAIAPISRESCDFGKGFYMGTDRNFNGEITDLALINSLSALKLGKQYAALTEKACQKIEILDEYELSENDRDKLKKESEANRSKGIEMANEICRKYRREGRFFDEILKDGY